MIKCKHKNITVVENAHTALTYLFSDGKMWHSYEDPGAIQHTIEVHCDDCKWKVKYSRNKLPAWLKPLIEQIGQTFEDKKQ